MRPSVLLFDIDGTLVLTGGAGARSLRRAFEAVCGESWGLEQLRFGGMTDLQILREALHAMGRVDDPETCERILETYLRCLPDEVARSTDYRVMPGVVDLLRRLAAETEVALGLGTGNIERGARIKLRPAELNEYFAFGGFGCDHIDRCELLRAGARRGASMLGCTLEQVRVVIIGDTPRDIAAAHAIGAECVAVATGSHPIEELTADGVCTFPDLTHGDVWSACMGD